MERDRHPDIILEQPTNLRPVEKEDVDPNAKTRLSHQREMNIAAATSLRKQLGFD